MATKQPEIKKPSRPLTAYHLFFQLERAWLLEDIHSPANGGALINEGYEAGKMIDPLMPNRYRDIYLPKTWYVSGSSKRKHTKRHGKISFQELSRRVAARWNSLEEIDPETKKYCEMIGKRESQSYKKKVKVYKASIGSEAIRSARSSNSSAIASFKLNQTSEGTYSSSIASSESSFSNLPNQMSSTNETEPPGLESTSTLIRKESSNLVVSSQFTLTSRKGNSKINVTASVKLNTSLVPKHTDDADFSFIPVPPSLLEQEDAFLERCQKRMRLLPPTYDSDMRELDAYISDAFNDECKDDHMSKKRSASDVSLNLCDDISPLKLGDAIVLLDYNFTEYDSEMLLKALF